MNIEAGQQYWLNDRMVTVTELVSSVDDFLGTKEAVLYKDDETEESYTTLLRIFKYYAIPAVLSVGDVIRSYNDEKPIASYTVENIVCSVEGEYTAIARMASSSQSIECEINLDNEGKVTVIEGGDVIEGTEFYYKSETLATRFRNNKKKAEITEMLIDALNRVQNIPTACNSVTLANFTESLEQTLNTLKQLSV